ncbi:UPF0301 protein YqgE [hydrothermal vent metagenome]|uniref:UPF0301 protein YqgE n=1 Tax=hydrothermal vent metagenome TaxID=652676 RepID=A0A3B0S4C6_9ZZZZ
MIKASYLDGQLLLAMPGMTDPRFDHSVIYICSHSEEGAMGLVVNSAAANIDFYGLLEQLDVDFDPDLLIGADDISGAGHCDNEIILHAGGPVEIGRGFILHSADYIQDSTLVISQTVALTATVDILAAIASGDGPKDFIIALGYTGWGKGQLEEEINRNSWLNIEPDDQLLFRTDLDLKWPRAMAKLGVDISMLSNHAGNA